MCVSLIHCIRNLLLLLFISCIHGKYSSGKEFLFRLTSTPHWRTGPDWSRGAPGCDTRRHSQGSVKQPQKKFKSNLIFTCRPFSGRRSRRSVRSGYAFAHSEGFGRLITSGRIMREVKIFYIYEATSERASQAVSSRLVVWGAVVAKAPMGRTMGRVKSQGLGGSSLSMAGVLARAMGQQREGLEGLPQSWLFLLDKLKISSLASSETISGLQVSFALKSWKGTWYFEYLWYEHWTHQLIQGQ